MSAPVLDEEREDRLRRLGVLALYLFGSRARGEEGPRSDHDYAVLMPESGHRNGGPLYMALYELLSEISPRTLANDVIDIVFLRDAPLELRFHVLRWPRPLRGGRGGAARLRVPHGAALLRLPAAARRDGSGDPGARMTLDGCQRLSR